MTRKNNKVPYEKKPTVLSGLEDRVRQIQEEEKRGALMLKEAQEKQPEGYVSALCEKKNDGDDEYSRLNYQISSKDETIRKLENDLESMREELKLGDTETARRVSALEDGIMRRKADVNNLMQERYNAAKEAGAAEAALSWKIDQMIESSPLFEKLRIKPKRTLYDLDGTKQEADKSAIIDNHNLKQRIAQFILPELLRFARTESYDDLNTRFVWLRTRTEFANMGDLNDLPAHNDAKNLRWNIYQQLATEMRPEIEIPEKLSD